LASHTKDDCGGRSASEPPSPITAGGVPGFAIAKATAPTTPPPRQRGKVVSDDPANDKGMDDPATHDVNDDKAATTKAANAPSP
jgi:hypothetical protein